MSERKLFLSSTDALGFGRENRESVVIASPKVTSVATGTRADVDRALSRFGNRIVTTLAEAPGTGLPIAEVLSSVQASAGPSFDFGEFATALKSLQANNVVLEIKSAQGTMFALTEEGEAWR